MGRHDLALLVLDDFLRCVSLISKDFDVAYFTDSKSNRLPGSYLSRSLVGLYMINFTLVKHDDVRDSQAC